MEKMKNAFKVLCHKNILIKISGRFYGIVRMVFCSSECRLRRPDSKDDGWRNKDLVDMSAYNI